MGDWKDKSNFEINKAVARLEHLIINDVQSASMKAKSSGVLVNCITEGFEFNPCNNPSDAWPIILENQISILNSDNDLWSAQKWVSDKRISHEFVRGRNALRAAMIVYLEMNGVKP